MLPDNGAKSTAELSAEEKQLIDEFLEYTPAERAAHIQNAANLMEILFEAGYRAGLHPYPPQSH
ncbi:MAG: hypothetical protein SFX74_00100 [Fimbriimonadaceae bacterium]|nr:hypothetical protein [Fimbriimonadaceae bacterium]